MKKVVFITGASSGIGLAVANYLSEKGLVVYGSSRNLDTDKKFSFNLVELELTNITSIKKAIATIINAEGQLDVLINNAGVGITGPVEETPTDEMRKSFDINFFGLIDVMKAVLPQMRSQKSGLIINITSIASYMGLPFRGVYSSLKGAARLLTESISMEVKKFGINVVNVAPGDFKTNIAEGRYHTLIIEDSDYSKAYQRNLDLMNTHVNDGQDPKELAYLIYKIIQSKKPKINYRVGTKTQKFSIILKRVLPNKIYEKILMRYYKM